MNGNIARWRRDGAIASLATVPAARSSQPERSKLYAVDFLGGRIVRVLPNGAVERFVESLARPAAVALDADGTVIVAEDTDRVLRLRPGD